MSEPENTENDEQMPENTENTVPETETFDRDYVHQLREEAAGARVKAKRADELARRLVGAYAAGTGKLADASDLSYSDELLDEDGIVDEDKVKTAIAELVRRKPHLASRRPAGDVGQGARPESESVSLVRLLRAGAG